MTTVIFGGSGFIGRRLIGLLDARGEEAVIADVVRPEGIDPARFRRCDLTRFDDVIATLLAVRPTRALNLAYYLGSDHESHTAFHLNITGTENFFEGCRQAEVAHAVYGSSLVVNGKQSRYGDRPVTEDDELASDGLQYTMHKIFNEYQAQDYRARYGMRITAVRPANVTGHDKVVGSVDHVQMITGPARGEAVSFPHADAMRCPVHVEDVAEAFARIALADAPKYTEYNTGGTTISMADLAEIVRRRIPGADISFDHETGGADLGTNYRIDNTRLREEFDLVPRDAEACVDSILAALGR